MDGHVWRVVYQAIRAADRAIPRRGRRCQYSDVWVVAMYLWSVAHDRPLCWACHREPYACCFRPRRWPSVSQFCKRVQTARVQQVLQKVHDLLSKSEPLGSLSFLDGRALCVGPCSKDREATRGPIPGGMGKGYKRHAWAGEDGRIPVWSVMPLNVSEKTVAGVLLESVPQKEMILADSGYDAGWLYDGVEEGGGCFLTPLPENAGGGHRPQSPSRLAAAEAWKSIAGYGYAQRRVIERIFAATATFGGGLYGLPPWVRTLRRVRRWVGAKLIIYHARWRLRTHAA